MNEQHAAGARRPPRKPRIRHYFLDPSALVKLYVVEPGSRVVQDIVRSAKLPIPHAEVSVCDLAYPETISALKQIAAGARSAQRGLSRAALRLALPRVHAHFASDPLLTLVPASPVIPRAAALVERHAFIRAADAVHVAAALEAAAAANTPAFYFVSADAAQCAVAESEGLTVLKPD